MYIYRELNHARSKPDLVDRPVRTACTIVPRTRLSSLRLMNCRSPIPNSQPTATELFQSPLYGSGTVFRSISHLLRHFPSSGVAWRHTSSNSVTRNYCCPVREVALSFMDTLITLTYYLYNTCDGDIDDVVQVWYVNVTHVSHLWRWRWWCCTGVICRCNWCITAVTVTLTMLYRCDMST